ncbi:hypothetical protein Tco_1276483 [Tanacetum coccineum]
MGLDVRCVLPYVTEHPPDDSGKREFRSLIKFKILMISLDSSSNLESTNGPSSFDTKYEDIEEFRLANGKTCDAILNKTFRVKIPTARTGAKQKKWKRKIRGGS